MLKHSHLKLSKLKRLIAIGLAAITVFTSIPLSSPHMHAHAEDKKVGDSADNKGAGDGGLDSSLSGNLSWYSKRQGYRIYIVNSNFERISPVYDFYNYDPRVDDIETYYYTTRFDSSISPDKSTAQEKTLEDLKNYCKATTNPPFAVLNLGGGNYQGNGTAFKAWFFAGAKGSSIELGNTGGSGAGSTATQVTSAPNTIKKPVLPAPTPSVIDNEYVPKCAVCQDKGSMLIGGTYVRCTNCSIKKCPICGTGLTSDRGICTTCEKAWYENKCLLCYATLNDNGLCPKCDIIAICIDCGSALLNGNCKTCAFKKLYCEKCYTFKNEHGYCPSCDYTTCYKCGRTIHIKAACEYCRYIEEHPECKLCGRTLDDDQICSTCSPRCSICNTLLDTKGTCYKHGNKGDIVVRVDGAEAGVWLRTSELPPTVRYVIEIGRELNYSSIVTKPNNMTYELLRGQTNKLLSDGFMEVYSVGGIHPDDALDGTIGTLYTSYLSNDYSKVLSEVQYVNMLLELKQEFMATNTYKDSFYIDIVIPGQPKQAYGPPSPLVNANEQNNNLESNITKVLDNSLTHTQIPLAGGDDEEEVHTTNGKSPVENLLLKMDGIRVPSYAEESQKTVEDETVEDLSEAYLAIEDGGYLIVEPITWLNKRTGTGAWDDPSQYTPYPVYGTYWNLVQGWVGGAGFYSTNLKELFNHCLITSKDIEYEDASGNIHKIHAVTDTSAKEITKSVKLMNEGYGLSMHAYNSNPVNFTSTYDEDLGEEKGPSPDDSSKVPEENKENELKYATIIKFYEDITLEEDDEDKYKVFVRSTVPKAIQFEDEYEANKYRIIKWFTTSNHYLEIAEGTKYDEFYESNAKLRESSNWDVYNEEKDEWLRLTLGDTTGVEKEEDIEKIEREKSLVILYQNTGGTSTYDEPQSTNPAPAPDDSNQLTPDQALDHKYHTQIIKFYEEIDPTTDTIITQEVHHRDPAPSLIDIEDEEEYEVKGWFTVKIEDHDASIDSTTTYESIKSTYTSIQSGDSTSTIELEVGKEATADTPAQECKENTLFVYLVKEGTPPPSDDGGTGILTQSKLTVKTTSDNSALNFTTKLSNHTFKLTTGALESSHTYYHDYNCRSCPGHTGSHTSSCYSKDEEGNSVLTCSSSHRWSHGYNCLPCLGHPHSMKLSDTSLSIKIKNKNDGSDTYIRAQLTGSSNFIGTLNKNSISKTREGFASDTYEEKNFVYSLVLYRGKHDPVYIYNGVTVGNVNKVDALGSTIASELSALGFNQSKYAIANRKDNGSFSKKLTLEIVDDGSDKNTSSVCTESDCGYTDSDKADWGDDYIQSADVTVGVYRSSATAGKANTTVNTSKMLSGFKSLYSAFNSEYTLSGAMVKSGAQFKFLPYVRMTYQGLGTGVKQVNALGTEIRTMVPNDYAEVIWKETNKANLNITSTMFSRHQSAINGSGGWKGVNQVLPGGASFSLDTQGKNQTLYLVTYQTVLMDEGYEQASYTGQDLSKFKPEKAIEEHKKYVKSAKEGLESTILEMFVGPYSSSAKAWDNGKAVTAGSDISFLHNGSSKSSTGSKYYFSKDSGNNLSSEGDLDVNEKNTATDYYTFYSDIKGNIYMKKNDESAQVILKKNQGVNKLTNEAAKRIDERTLVITKLVDAIDRNSGNDSEASWVSDGKWYNEAFNGVTIMVQMTEIEVGLQYPSTRGLVIDPKLIPEMTNKGDMFNEAYQFQFKVNNVNKYGDAEKIGEFKGTGVYMKDLDMLFHSDKKYIPNATVDDLSN